MTHQDPDLTHTPDDTPAVPAHERADAEAVDAVPPADEASADADAFRQNADAAADDGAEADDGAAEEDPLAAAQRERDEYLDALRRKQAEFENFRKRMMRDGATQRIHGHAEVAERMLDVLDDFDRTIAAAVDTPSEERRDEVDPGFLKGVELVHDKLVAVLEDFGLTRIEDGGDTFDPTRHEAVQQVDADEDLDQPQVHQVLRPGYELGGRVLRPAMVVVRQ